MPKEAPESFIIISGMAIPFLGLLGLKPSVSQPAIGHNQLKRHVASSI